MADHGSRFEQIRNRHRAARESFYSLSTATVSGKACCGTACFVARHLAPHTWAEARVSDVPVYCLGKCYTAPASDADHSRPIIEVHSRQPVVLERIVNGGARSHQAYLDQGGYRALDRAQRMSVEDILRAVEGSELRGRGGAGFPTGRKWRAVARQPATPKYIVVNADEGDPGAYIDRFILEDDPHRLIEAMTIAARALDAD